MRRDSRAHICDAVFYVVNTYQIAEQQQNEAKKNVLSRV